MSKRRKGTGTTVKFQDQKGRWQSKFIPGGIPKGCKAPQRICIKCLKGKIPRATEFWRYKICEPCWNLLPLQERLDWISNLALDKGEKYASAVNRSKNKTQ